VQRRVLKRAEVSNFFANLPVCLIGMEACSSAHYWARTLTALGHDVRLMSPQFVKPYVKTNKNDRNDAEAICEAVGRPNMRFVLIKSEAQLDILAVHRVRQRLVGHKTALVNQIRGLLAERGIVVARDITSLRRHLPEILENASNGLSETFRSMLPELAEQMRTLTAQVEHYNQVIRRIVREHEPCQRLTAIEGIGPLTASALYASAGDARTFKNGRQFAAWLGLVPKQHASGGKPRLLGISKRGDVYLRTLLIHGGRAALGRASHK
jgi:transposase